MNEGKISGIRTLVLGAMLLLGLPAVSSAQGDFEDVFIFGDSLSDGGNIYALTGETSKAPYALVPNRPYAIGGHHFSNGKTWAERLAQDLGDTDGGKPSMTKPGKNGNYAFGGARARSGSGNSSPDSFAQIYMYLGDHGAASADALYIVQFGGNDLRDALVAVKVDPDTGELDLTDSFGIIQTAVMQLVDNIGMLAGAGAKHILVANSPNLFHAPAVKLSGAELLGALFAGHFNAGLAGGLSALQGMDPTLNIYQLDMGGFTDAVVTNPSSFGLTNVVAPCLSFMGEKDAKCDNPDEFLFWDGLHPTAAAHNALAAEALAVVYGN